jgi:hypothetical protein
VLNISIIGIKFREDSQENTVAKALSAKTSNKIINGIDRYKEIFLNKRSVVCPTG